MTQATKTTLAVDRERHRLLKIFAATKGKTVEELTAVAIDNLLASGVAE